MEKMQVHEYVEALEEERRKIQVFHRELPLCLQLVTQAIEACRRQVSSGTAAASENKSECSEQTTSTGPVLEEFMPIKRSTDCSDDDGGDVRRQSRKDDDEENDKKKSDWLRSVQLWNETPDPAPKVDLPRKTPLTEMKRSGGGFQPFKKEKSVGKTGGSVGKLPSSVPPTAMSSTAGTVSGGSKREEKDGQAQRKQRRCWSPELHRRFLNSLQQLGGSHAATPKQIRELMKVDGLTNDEVKSHLQKYRLHARRPSPAVPNNANPQAPQFVVVGSIWVQPPEYTAAAAAASGEAGSVAAANKIYSPVAAPPRLQQKQQPERSHSGSHSGGGVHSNSSATSSSTHTTTASPEF